MPARRLAARWVVPVAAPPIECGAILLGSDGRIEAVGPDAVVPRPAGVPGEAFPDAILIPGLVNAHTHLELTGFDFGAPPEADFRSWIGRVRGVKETRSRDDFVAWAGRCTHAACGVIWEPAEGVVYCPCHGARFAADGEVVRGPAEDPLPVFPLELVDDALVITLPPA